MLEAFLSAQWQKKNVWVWLTAPLAMIFCLLVRFRRWAYERGLKKSWRASIPVVVVGNLTVGGSGKSPLVAHIVAELQHAGWRPVIIARGYKSASGGAPILADEQASPGKVGDEAVMLAKKTGVPVVVGRDRSASVRWIAAEGLGDVVVSDDGFQHLGLHRDVQLLVVDGARGYGNGWCLPAGPLREPVSAERLADAIVINGENRCGYRPQVGQALSMRMQLLGASHIWGGEQRALSAFIGQAVHAVAGTGYPQRFFDMLEALGLEVIPHAFPDHHAYRADEVQFADNKPVLVTEKDAVKLREVLSPVRHTHQASDPSPNTPQVWVVPVVLDVDNGLMQRILEKLGSAP